MEICNYVCFGHYEIPVQNLTSCNELYRNSISHIPNKIY